MLFLALPQMKKPLGWAKEVWQQLIAPSPTLQNPVQRQLSRNLASWLLFFLFVLVVLFAVRFPFGVSTSEETWVRLLLIFVAFATYLLNRRGYFRPALLLVLLIATLTVFMLARIEGGEAGLQILNYLAVVVFFASLFYQPRLLSRLFAVHLGGMLAYGAVEPGLTLRQMVDGPISLNLTLTLVIMLITYQRNRLDANQRRAINRERRLFRQLATYSPDTIWVLHGTSGELNIVSQTLFFGYPAADLQNLDDIRALVHEADLTVFNCFWQSDLADSLPDRSYECRMRHKDGRYEWVHTRVATLPPEDETGAQRFLCLTAVVTEYRRSVAARQRESLSLLAGGVAHDFNNLLVAVQSQLSLATHKLTLDRPAQSHIDKARTATDRIEAITAKLLAYSGHGNFVMQPVNLPEMIAENYARLRQTLPDNITVERKIAPDIALVEADSGQLKQMLLNLFFNAIEAVGDGDGVVSVSIEMAQVETLNFSLTGLPDQELASGEYVVLTVKDNGCGIDPETAVRIFEPFFTTKEMGRGLGLPAVLGIVRGHGGAVTVESEVGAGTSVRVYLPPFRPDAVAG